MKDQKEDPMATTPITTESKEEKKKKKKKKRERKKLEENLNVKREKKRKKKRLRDDDGSDDADEHSLVEDRASDDEIKEEKDGVTDTAISNHKKTNERKEEENSNIASDEMNDEMTKPSEKESLNSMNTSEEKSEGQNKDKDNEEVGEDEAAVGKKRKRKRKRKKNNMSGDNDGDGNGSNVTAGGEISQQDKLSSLDYTVYVEGIRFDGNESDVKEFFVKNGCPDVLQMRMARWQDSGRLRGYGHVVFDTTASCAKAIAELNGRNLNGRYLTIRPSNQRANTTLSTPRAQPTGCRTVFIKNLPYDSSEEDIHTIFRSCGKIVDGGVRLARNYATGHFKGFAYVEFKNPEGAQAAVNRGAKSGGIAVKGRACFVDYDEGSVKGSYRGGDGKLWQKEYGNKNKDGNDVNRGNRNTRL